MSDPTTTYDRAEHQRHLVEIGQENIATWFKLSKEHQCKNPECQMDVLFFDLSEEQIEGCAILLARTVHFIPGNYFHLFQHLVDELARRRELKAEVIDA